MKGTDKLPERKLQEKLDSIIEPLIDQVYLLNDSIRESKLSAKENYESYRDRLKELFSVAVSEGVNLSELVNTKLEKEIIKRMDNPMLGKDLELAKNLNESRKIKHAAASLNMQDKSGKQKRFVTPDELNELGKLKK